MLKTASVVSCGVYNLHDLGDVTNEKYLHDFFRHMYDYTYVFSDNEDWGNGARFAAWIKKHKLGRIVSVKDINPVHNSHITTWVWAYNGKKPKDYKV